MTLPIAVALVAGLSFGSVSFAPRPVAAAAVQAAAPTVTLSASSIAIGGQVNVSAAGFAANETVTLSISQQTAPLATLKADANGAVSSTAVTIPTTLSPGAHTLTLTGSTSHRSVSTSVTLVAGVSVSATTIPMGGSVTVSGAGFAAGESVAITINQVSAPLATVQADIHGVVVPTTVKLDAITLSPGTHTLTLTGSSSHRTASMQVTLIPSVTVSATSATLGSQVTISGAGFSANEVVDVTISGQSAPLATLKAGQHGLVSSTSITIPKSLAQGTHTLTLTGTTSHRTASVQIALTPQIIASLTALLPSVTPGNAVSFSGGNWAASEAIDISISGYNGTLAVVHADANGILAPTPVRLPSSLAAGTHTVTATGTVSKRTATTMLTIVAPVSTQITVTPSSTNRGGLITVSGSNFAANESVTVTIQGLSTPLATLKANAQGQIPPTGVTVPYSVSVGAHVVQLTGASSKHTATAKITVAALTPSIAVNMSTVKPGNTVTVSGKGFGSHEQLTIALNGAALPTTPPVVTTNNGAFTATFTVPASLLRGANTISVIGNESQVSATATLAGLLPTAATLYFAGASTMGTDQAALAILNTSAQPAHLDLTFYYRSGLPGHATMDIPARSRATANLNGMAGGNRAFGVKMTADRSVTAQLRELRPGKDGFELLGVSAPNTTWYLAEGYTGSTFHEMLSLVNPGSIPAQVQLRLLPFGGRAARTVNVMVAPQSAQPVDVNSLMPNQSLSVIANASQPIVLARTLTFSTHGYGITGKTGVNTPATTWIFAEGAAAVRGLKHFQTFLTVLNPNAVGTYVTASFYGRTGGSLGNRTVYVAGLSRANIKLNTFLRAANIASVVTSDLPVVVERPEYAGNPNGVNVAGSDVFGRNGAGTSWTFPGGDTTVRDELLYIYNPSPRTVDIMATFYGTDGQILTKRLYVPPTVQYVVDVRALLPNTTMPHGVTLRSINGLGFIAEQTSFALNYATLRATQGFAS